MPTRKFSLESGGPERIAVSWSGIWKNLQVTFDGNPVGSIETKKELQAGRDFALPDGSTLHVQLKQEAMVVELQVMRNGTPLPGSANDPEQRVAAAAAMLFVIAALNAGLGILALAGNVTFLVNMGMGTASIFAGGIYGFLGFLVKTRQSRLALVLAIILFVVDGVFIMALVTMGSGRPPIGAFVARLFLLIPLWKGLGPIKELNARKA